MRRVRLQRGWSTAEYMAALVGLMVVWRGSQALLEWLVEHHYEFSWALMIPF